MMEKMNMTSVSQCNFTSIFLRSPDKLGVVSLFSYLSMIYTSTKTACICGTFFLFESLGRHLKRDGLALESRPHGSAVESAYWGGSKDKNICNLPALPLSRKRGAVCWPRWVDLKVTNEDHCTYDLKNILLFISTTMK